MAINAAWREDPVEPNKPRKRGGQSVACQVRNSIRDCLGSLNAAELDQIRVEGLTLRERLTRDKTLEQQHPGSIKFGKNYFAALRAKYSSKNSLEKRLQLDRGQPVSPEFRQAFLACLAHPPRRGEMRAWLVAQTEATITLPDVCGVFVLFAKQHPSLSQEVYALCETMVESMVRLKMKELAPRRFSHIQHCVCNFLMQVQLHVQESVHGVDIVHKRVGGANRPYRLKQCTSGRLGTPVAGYKFCCASRPSTPP